MHFFSIIHPNSLKKEISFVLLSLLILFSSQKTLAQAQKLRNSKDPRDISYITSGGKLNPLQAIMDIRHYTISLKVDIDHKSIEGFTEVNIKLGENTDTLLFDLVHLLTVSKIKVNGREYPFQQRDDRIYILNPNKFKKGNLKIWIAYGGEPPVAIRPPWNGGFTWTKDSGGNPWVAINCQLEGAKLYFPCKDHPSDEPNEGVDLFITVPKGLVVAGPGLLKGVKTKGEISTFHWQTHYTISNYCIVFDIGKYVVKSRNYTTLLGNKVPMQYYVLEADSAQAKRVLDVKTRDTHILEKYFGEYPWVKEKIGLAEVPNPGMEHQTMVTFQNKFVYQTIGGQDYSANLFHEFAHEWWANKVTNKDWAHMWIQEGIATYAEALCMQEIGGIRAYDSIIDGNKRRISNTSPILKADEGVTEGETYNRDIYFKGSFFMHSLRYLLGDSIFLPTLKKLATEPQYTYDNFVTTNDVEKLFSGESGQNLKPFFDFWLRTNQVLNFKVTETDFHTYKIQIQNYFMPLPVEVSTAEGTKRMMIGENGIYITGSIFPPRIDEKGFYLKTISY